MARYIVYAPVFIGRRHLAIGASIANPQVIELPDDTPASLKWDALDPTALRNIQKCVEDKIAKEASDLGLDPQKDSGKYNALVTKVRALHKKEQIKPPEEKVKPRDVETMSELSAQRGKLAGRSSDKSPV